MLAHALEHRGEQIVDIRLPGRRSGRIHQRVLANPSEFPHHD
jgi:hypothetical protein